jgi:hypothetical protein
LHVDPVLRCLDDPKGLNNGYLPSGCGPQVPELANGLRPVTTVPSQDLDFIANLILLESEGIDVTLEIGLVKQAQGTYRLG